MDQLSLVIIIVIGIVSWISLFFGIYIPLMLDPITQFESLKYYREWYPSPNYLHRHTKLNWVGAYVVGFMLAIIMFPLAIVAFFMWIFTI